jgi:CMP/dCMP kinase
MKKIITIDGPAGSGKTTVARELAKRLGYQYFDTGAMFRLLTYQIMQENVALEDGEALEALLSRFTFDARPAANGSTSYFVQGEDVTEKIRLSDVTQRVSQVSAHPLVRQALAKIQREFGLEKNGVFEGRDMGSVVFEKDAFIKFFLTASPSVRAWRRYKELKEKVQGIQQQEILSQILLRDQMDSERQYAPLKQAEDAILIDTSDKSVEQVVQQLLDIINKKKPAI